MQRNGDTAQIAEFFWKISFPVFIDDFGPAILKITSCRKRFYRL